MHIIECMHRLHVCHYAVYLRHNVHFCMKYIYINICYKKKVDTKESRCYFFSLYSCGKKQAATYRFNSFTVRHDNNLQTHTATNQSQCLQNNKSIQQ